MEGEPEKEGSDGLSGPEVLLLPSRTRPSKTGYLFYWHVHQGDKRAGKAYISISRDGAPFVTVILNKAQQGRGIGKSAFRKACELSGLAIVYAEVRRSNIPSQKALKKAGFTPFGRNASGEDILVWRTKRSE